MNLFLKFRNFLFCIAIIIIIYFIFSNLVFVGEIKDNKISYNQIICEDYGSDSWSCSMWKDVTILISDSELSFRIRKPSKSSERLEMIITKLRYSNKSIDEFYSTHKFVGDYGVTRRYSPNDIEKWEDVFILGEEMAIVSPQDTYLIQLAENLIIKRVMGEQLIIIKGNYVRKKYNLFGKQFTIRGQKFEEQGLCSAIDRVCKFHRLIDDELIIEDIKVYFREGGF